MCKKATKYYQTCDKCRSQTPLKRVFVVSTYNDKVKKLVHAMKIGSSREASKIIVQILLDNAPYYHDFCVVNIPTAPSHVRERSFDHSKLIAKQFAGSKELEFNQLLTRHDKAKQVGKSRQLRLSQLKGVFEVAEPANIPKKVLLIDDITTTGATLNEAAKTLIRAKVKEIEALVFAQTV
jgi:ComF family protein